MKVRWTPEAEADRLAIWTYLVKRAPAAALDLDERFGRAAAALADFPLSGHEGAVPGTRELTPHRRYRLVYQVVDDAIWILVLIHAARLWPPLRDE
ncbi:type II toxin-antitoxin system RelE/ParE family toxin [uncultured Sphingomonas sp.]|uniref:type II toxin-antitoxin system RelE/ParE family toxin n=1 Tax=uncultured Sphingomonas sp. TaxID=158754 RepID=UPI0025D5C26E|nr:type II toxin-antitoxin system RelE/ParE family toxin [uncultured Sphingomonas sp.]